MKESLKTPLSSEASCPCGAQWNASGEPENLAAAAEDAIEWLRVMRHWSPPGRIAPRAEDRQRILACIAALEKQLGKEQA